MICRDCNSPAIASEDHISVSFQCLNASCNKIFLPSEGSPPSKFVYHVAHPQVKGEITALLSDGKCEVLFQEEVLFLNLPESRRSRTWVCTRDFLFYSQQEAQHNHNPNHNKVEQQ